MREREREGGGSAPGLMGGHNPEFSSYSLGTVKLKEVSQRNRKKGNGETDRSGKEGLVKTEKRY